MIASAAAHDAVERAARESYGKLVAFLARRCGSVGAAEEALSDAFAAALERWPADGIPRSPEAWLVVAARRRFVDRVRRERRDGSLHERLAVAVADAHDALEREADVGDERLGLMFACAHPAISEGVRAPLILQAVLGVDAARIASAFLVAPSAMSQRLVRAKAKIATAGIPLGEPAVHDVPRRLPAVLDAIYATFAHGWDDAAGADPRTRGLAAEAVWLGRMVVRLCPREPEALGLLALMLAASARAGARRDPGGTYVPLEAQDPARWDAAMADEAELLLARAAQAKRIGRFQLEAALQSAHMTRRFGTVTDWHGIVTLYDALLARLPSPVVALNRAVALARLRGSAAGLAALDELSTDVRFRAYQPYWAARADLCTRAGDGREALAAYARAIGLTSDPSVRRFLEARRDDIERGIGAAPG